MGDLLGVVALSLGVVGCGYERPADVPDPDLLWVNEIKVVGESDGFGNLEIEVQLHDNATQEYLGCADLGPADDSDAAYYFQLFFQRDGVRVQPDDLSGHQVVLQVIEDDLDRCAPLNIAGGDTLIGTSPPIAGATLGTSGPLSFGRVALLRFGLYPAP